MNTLAPWLAQPLSRLLAQQGHAWLVTGQAGLGQFDLSMALAASWLCEQPQADHSACGSCEACHLVQAKSHPDLRVLLPETLSLSLGYPLDEKTQDELDDKKRKPSKQIKIDAVQDLISFVQRTSSRGKGLVVVIYPAEAMNHVAANALLKSLEEPAGHSRFVLATQDSAALLPTIRSRCQSFALMPPTTDAALVWLQAQGIKATDAPVWLKAAGGQPQTALAMSQAIVKSSAWLEVPKLVMRGAAPNEWPSSLVETPSALVSGLQKLCHDWLCVGQGAAPRFFDADTLLAAASHVAKDVTRQNALYKLTNWSKALNQHARASEHTLNAGLMIEALLAEAKQAVAIK